MIGNLGSARFVIEPSQIVLPLDSRLVSLLNRATRRTTSESTN
ncbi:MULTISPECIES: hypothetical protein [Leptolyngbya]|uniref:Uncharacterized protein n=1 Tax=Leptolyngbya boryana CZ1 TaxID=3060204 RepID=A0AA96WSC4_LEPBY|nr:MULTISPECIES: hypothetical protein [Leptolyngbya]MCY6492058.1 hypothetical protein [Leptolyngbya sp. GGD]WNZ44563.1 hypothetical protein Q2T42_22450 [Leptolyngbya boryana CZ1]